MCQLSTLTDDEVTLASDSPGFEALVAGILGDWGTSDDGFDAVMAGVTAAMVLEDGFGDALDTSLSAMDAIWDSLAGTSVDDLAAGAAALQAVGDLDLSSIASLPGISDIAAALTQMLGDAIGGLVGGFMEELSQVFAGMQQIQFEVAEAEMDIQALTGLSPLWLG
jgi:hypothetical protein